MLLSASFEPAAIEPRLLVNRDEEKEKLYQSLAQYLRADVHLTGRGYCVLGEKGSGKSILVRSALQRLRQQMGGVCTIFLEADCRTCRGRRGVFGRIAQEAVRELSSLQEIDKQAGDRVEPSLVNTARLLLTLTRFTTIEITEAHQQLVRHRQAVSLKGEKALLSFLKTTYDYSLEIEKKQERSLIGKISVDDNVLCDALCAFFRDVREQHISVVLFIDNIDELMHEYRDGEVREKVRQDVKSILNLHRAPVAMVAAMRSYLGGILPREISSKVFLRRLTPEHLTQIVEHRIDEQSEAVKQAGRTPQAQAALKRISQIAGTPLALINWYKFLFEVDLLAPDRIDRGLVRFLEENYSLISVPILRRVAAAFSSPDSRIPRAKLLEACEGNDAVMSQLEDRQAILPVDFWNPVEYTLDPELHFLHPDWAQT